MKDQLYDVHILPSSIQIDELDTNDPNYLQQSVMYLLAAEPPGDEFPEVGGSHIRSGFRTNFGVSSIFSMMMFDPKFAKDYLHFTNYQHKEVGEPFEETKIQNVIYKPDTELEDKDYQNMGCHYGVFLANLLMELIPSYYSKAVKEAKKGNRQYEKFLGLLKVMEIHGIEKGDNKIAYELQLSESDPEKMNSYLGFGISKLTYYHATSRNRLNDFLYNEIKESEEKSIMLLYLDPEKFYDYCEENDEMYLVYWIQHLTRINLYQRSGLNSWTTVTKQPLINVKGNAPNLYFNLLIEKSRALIAADNGVPIEYVKAVLPINSFAGGAHLWYLSLAQSDYPYMKFIITDPETGKDTVKYACVGVSTVWKNKITKQWIENNVKRALEIRSTNALDQGFPDTKIFKPEYLLQITLFFHSFTTDIDYKQYKTPFPFDAMSEYVDAGGGPGLFHLQLARLDNKDIFDDLSRRQDIAMLFKGYFTSNGLDDIDVRCVVPLQIAEEWSEYFKDNGLEKYTEKEGITDAFTDFLSSMGGNPIGSIYSSTPEHLAYVEFLGSGGKYATKYTKLSDLYKVYETFKNAVDHFYVVGLYTKTQTQMLGGDMRVPEIKAGIIENCKAIIEGDNIDKKKWLIDLSKIIFSGEFMEIPDVEIENEIRNAFVGSKISERQETIKRGIIDQVRNTIEHIRTKYPLRHELYLSDYLAVRLGLIYKLGESFKLCPDITPLDAEIFMNYTQMLANISTGQWQKNKIQYILENIYSEITERSVITDATTIFNLSLHLEEESPALEQFTLRMISNDLVLDGRDPTLQLETYPYDYKNHLGPDTAMWAYSEHLDKYAMEDNDQVDELIPLSEGNVILEFQSPLNIDLKSIEMGFIVPDTQYNDFMALPEADRKIPFSIKVMDPNRSGIIAYQNGVFDLAQIQNESYLYEGILNAPIRNITKSSVIAVEIDQTSARSEVYIAATSGPSEAGEEDLISCGRVLRDGTRVNFMHNPIINLVKNNIQDITGYRKVIFQYDEAYINSTGYLHYYYFDANGDIAKRSMDLSAPHPMTGKPWTKDDIKEFMIGRIKTSLDSYELHEYGHKNPIYSEFRDIYAIACVVNLSDFSDTIVYQKHIKKTEAAVHVRLPDDPEDSKSVNILLYHDSARDTQGVSPSLALDTCLVTREFLLDEGYYNTYIIDSQQLADIVTRKFKGILVNFMGHLPMEVFELSPETTNPLFLVGGGGVPLGV
jgi:hypothetical protein